MRYISDLPGHVHRHGTSWLLKGASTFVPSQRWLAHRNRETNYTPGTWLSQWLRRATEYSPPIENLVRSGMYSIPYLRTGSCCPTSHKVRQIVKSRIQILARRINNHGRRQSRKL
jgi:hypothetical protein